jgi:FtsP/CotA-like multicopper oxidase with cupredoxin domain
MSKKLLLLGLAIAICFALAPAQAKVRNVYIAATDGFAYLPADNAVPEENARKYYIRGFCDDVDEAGQATQGCAMFPAPIVDVTQGDDVFIRLRNLGNLNPLAPEDPHTIHLHGIHVTSQNDGFPETSWEVPEGDYGVYYFRAENAGTYMWHCHVEASEHVQMGMYGGLIIRPRKRRNDTVYGGFANDIYNREYVLLLSDVEVAGHDFIQTALCAEDPGLGCTPLVEHYSFGEYDPDAWIVNGRAFPDTVAPPSTPEADEACATLDDPATSRNLDTSTGDFDGCNPMFGGPPSGYLTGSNNSSSYATVVQAELDDRILLRMINMGYEPAPWHIHGWHFQTVGKDARAIPVDSQKEEQTLHIASGETYDLIIRADDLTDVGRYADESNFYGDPHPIAQLLGTCPGGVPCDSSMDGVTDEYWFPMHSHDDYKVTNFGAYPGGQLTIMHVMDGL